MTSPHESVRNMAGDGLERLFLNVGSALSKSRALRSRLHDQTVRIKEPIQERVDADQTH